MMMDRAASVGLSKADKKTDDRHAEGLAETVDKEEGVLRLDRAQEHARSSHDTPCKAIRRRGIGKAE